MLVLEVDDVVLLGIMAVPKDDALAVKVEGDACLWIFLDASPCLDHFLVAVYAPHDEHRGLFHVWFYLVEDG